MPQQGTSIQDNALYSQQGCQQEKVDKDLVSRACEGILAIPPGEEMLTISIFSGCCRVVYSMLQALTLGDVNQRAA